MNRRERVLTSLRHEEPDMVPYQLDFTQAAISNVAEYLGDDDFLSKLGNHLAIMEWGGFEEVAPGFFRDHFGVVWNRTIDKDIGIVSEYILKDPTLKRYRFPDPAECPIPVPIELFVRQNPDVFRVVGIGFSLFERAWTLRGMENLLADMILNPRFVHELLDAITEYNLALIERSLEYDIDCFRFGDDWGQQRGLIMGPKLWSEFIRPRMEKMFARVKEAGKYVMLHSCGKVQELFPALIDMGLDIFNTFQPEIMDVDLMKREYGNHLTFYGGISTQRLLPFATPGEVKTVVKDMMCRIGRNGGYIVAPTHAMPGDIPPENILAFVEAVQNQ